jgi:hypothetical protein
MFPYYQEYCTEENKYKYNTTPEFFGEGVHLFFADYHGVYDKVNKTDYLNYKIIR